MKIETICQHCKNEIKIKTNANTRIDLEMERGELFNISCESCKKISEVHVNAVYAKINPIISIGGFVIGFVMTIIFWSMMGLIATITMTIPILIANQQSASIKAFNNYRL